MLFDDTPLERAAVEFDELIPIAIPTGNNGVTEDDDVDERCMIYFVIARNAEALIRSFSCNAIRINCCARRISGESFNRISNK